ncbi:Sec-independent protein translocase subunit TatA [Isoptericola dokdonensis]|uniref:Sec-independent protein translocase protein TatA n=1 Tax=Isoptericola dokdonensis DS-3 TaxID=1300344 RepID=A0A168EMN2_9MICO|nr:Sec-independent protein translocase subunit TatA [Isoptericola dokdonensis]ANC30229.1 twin arginine translocase protein A [Isoptericola dokdonensis DS-3]
MRIFESPAVLVALIVLVIVLFGAKRLPDVAKSVGSSLKIFKKEVKDLRDDDKDAPDAPAQPPAPTSTSTPAQPAAPAQDPSAASDEGTTRPSSTGSATS